MPLVLALILSIVVLGAPAQAREATVQNNPCTTGSTIKHNRFGSVREYRAEYYACSPRLTVRAELGPSRDTSSSAHVVLAERVQLRGRYVAWVKSCYCDDFTRVDLYRLNLKRGRKKFIASALNSNRTGVVLALRLSQRGSLAWIANDYAAYAPVREVWISNQRGTHRIARGSKIQELRVKSHTVSWRQDGRSRRHRLD